MTLTNANRVNLVPGQTLPPRWPPNLGPKLRSKNRLIVQELSEEVQPGV